MTSDTCAYPNDTEGAHDHDACEDALANCCDAFSATAGEVHDDACAFGPVAKLRATGTPDLVREYASIRVANALLDTTPASHARLGVVVTELRRRGVLDNR